MATTYFSPYRPAMMVAIAFLMAFSPLGVISADLEKETGLRYAPKDADLFVSGLRLTEQWQRFQSTQLFRNIEQNSLVQKFITRWQGEWKAREGQAGQLRAATQDPNIQSLLAMGADMVSEEIFMMADGQFSKTILQVNELIQEANEVAADEERSSENLSEFFMSLTKSDLDEIPVPTIVQGFKVSDTDRVLDKIDQLEGIIRLGLGSIPGLSTFAEGVQRIEDDRGTRLAWTITADMVPWGMMTSSGNVDADIVNKIQDLLEDRQLCFTIGNLDQYLIIALSENAEAIAKLGKGDTLLQHPDMNPVKEVSNKIITAVSYVSDQYADVSFQTSFKDFFSRNSQALIQQAERVFDGDLLEALQRLPDDLAAIDESIDALIPDFKGATMVSFLTDGGVESIAHNRTEEVVFDPSKPLPVLSHLGKDPIAFIAFRLQDHPEYFATIRDIVRKSKSYIEAYVESDYADDQQKKKGNWVLEKLWPLLTEFADLWEKKFLPAMKDGQHAWVLQSGNLSSMQWWKDMPKSTKPLPIPESAIVTGLTSREEMIEAYSELFDWFDRLVVVWRQVEPDMIPASYTVPKPKQANIASGERYLYPIPDDCPVPKTMAPQALFTKDFMISTYSDLQTNLLASTQSLSVGTSLIDASKPYAQAAYVHLGKLSQLALPWIGYGFEQQFESIESVISPEEGSFPEVKVKDVLELWTALGSLGEMTSSTVARKQQGTITRSIFSMPSFQPPVQQAAQPAKN